MNESVIFINSESAYEESSHADNNESNERDCFCVCEYDSFFPLSAFGMLKNSLAVKVKIFSRMVINFFFLHDNLFHPIQRVDNFANPVTWGSSNPEIKKNIFTLIRANIKRFRDGSTD